MAKTLWGNVYFKDTYAGRLEEQPGGRCVFTYDSTYIENGNPAIAYTLPLRSEAYISERGLHPFFDNLVAEGWFQKAQARALGVNPNHRFALLLGFGSDLAGAVSVVDPEPQTHYSLQHTDEVTLAALQGRASLSGVQRKLLVVKDGAQYRPVGPNELSTHIAKLPSGNLSELLELEYLSTKAASVLLANDDVVTMEVSKIAHIKENALVIPRFDRSATGKRLRHFEEFNQLLGRYSGEDKYDGSYEEMGQFILNTPNCIPAEADRLFRRVLVCFLIGNTDAHFKNFAMFHTREGLRLTPAYDLVAASVYPEYQTIALHISGMRDLQIGLLSSKHVLRMATSYGVTEERIIEIVESLESRLASVFTAIERSKFGSESLKRKLQEVMQKRWNGCFKLIGQRLLKKQSKDVKRKS